MICLIKGKVMRKTRCRHTTLFSSSSSISSGFQYDELRKTEIHRHKQRLLALKSPTVFFPPVRVLFLALSLNIWCMACYRWNVLGSLVNSSCLFTLSRSLSHFVFPCRCLRWQQQKKPQRIHTCARKHCTSAQHSFIMDGCNGCTLF